MLENNNDDDGLNSVKRQGATKAGGQGRGRRQGNGRRPRPGGPWILIKPENGARGQTPTGVGARGGAFMSRLVQPPAVKRSRWSGVRLIVRAVAPGLCTRQMVHDRWACGKDCERSRRGQGQRGRAGWA